MKPARISKFSPAALALWACAGCGVQEHPNAAATSAGVVNPTAPASAGFTGSASGGSAAPVVASGGTGVGGMSAAGVIAGAGGAPNDSAGAGVGGGTGGVSAAGAMAGTGGAPGDMADAGAAGTAAEPAPASNEGIDINGTFVPRDHAIVFIHFGHSNMAGRALGPSSLRSYFYTPRANLWSYKNGQFVPAKEPTAPDNTIGQGAGPGMAWLIAASERAGPDYHFISIAKAQTSAPSSDFVKGGLYYDSLVEPAKQLKGKVTFGAIFSMLGITDRHLPASQQGGFAERMVSIAADIRADLEEPNLPMLNCDYEMEATGSLAPTGSVGRQFIPQIQMLPTLIPNSTLIPTDGLDMQDDHHFTMTGHKDWAERGVQLMVDKGWFPWMP